MTRLADGFCRSRVEEGSLPSHRSASGFEVPHWRHLPLQLKWSLMLGEASLDRISHRNPGAFWSRLQDGDPGVQAETQPLRCEIPLYHLPLKVPHRHRLKWGDLLLCCSSPPEKEKSSADTLSHPMHVEITIHRFCAICFCKTLSLLLTEIEMSSEHLLCSSTG